MSRTAPRRRGLPERRWTGIARWHAHVLDNGDLDQRERPIPHHLQRPDVGQLHADLPARNPDRRDPVQAIHITSAAPIRLRRYHLCTDHDRRRSGNPVTFSVDPNSTRGLLGPGRRHQLHHPGGPGPRVLLHQRRPGGRQRVPGSPPGPADDHRQERPAAVHAPADGCRRPHRRRRLILSRCNGDVPQLAVAGLGQQWPDLELRQWRGRQQHHAELPRWRLRRRREVPRVLHEQDRTRDGPVGPSDVVTLHLTDPPTVTAHPGTSARRSRARQCSSRPRRRAAPCRASSGRCPSTAARPSRTSPAPRRFRSQGQTVSNYGFQALASQNAYRYRALFTNASGSTPSNSAFLSVYFDPAVTLDPVDQTANAAGSRSSRRAPPATPSPR